MINRHLKVIFYFYARETSLKKRVKTQRLKKQMNFGKCHFWVFVFVCLFVSCWGIADCGFSCIFPLSLSLSLSWEISEKLLQLLWMRGREWKVLFNDQNFRHTPKKIVLFKMKLFRGKKTFSRLLHFRCCSCKGRSLSSRQLHQPKTRISKEFDLT